MKVLVIDLFQSTVGIAQSATTEGKYTAVSPTGERWEHCELRPLTWKRGRVRVRDLEVFQVEPFKKSL